MDERAMKAMYGPEYPNALLVSGVRMPLEREGRFMRHYSTEDGKQGAAISKFSDGTATITHEELQREWFGWSARDRGQFCGASSWLVHQADFPDMLRFIMQHGEPEHWSGIAIQVATCLPQEEAYQTLVNALHKLERNTANISQGISLTKHPRAREELSLLLERLWVHPNLWDDDSFTNWHAFDALCCIQHLLDLGAPPEEHESRVRRLFEHKCSGNRDSCSSYLHKYYAWLPKPEFPPFAA